uniref:MFS domain-containing protein n=1 Tax=Trichuris muris TaxID=70415 RepID=A0A5S6QUB9_TRIMR
MKVRLVVIFGRRVNRWSLKSTSMADHSSSIQVSVADESNAGSSIDFPAAKRKKSVVFLTTAFLAMAAMVHALLTRTLSIALICMTSGSSNSHDMHGNGSSDSHGMHGNGSSEYAHANSSCNTSAQSNFDWNYFVQGNVIAMHDWGELVFIPFTGFFISIGNPTLILLAASALSIMSAALFPVSVQSADYKGAMVSRFFLGISHAFTSPAVDAVANHWLPKVMRSTLYSFITSGSQVALLIGNPMVAAFCHACVMGGWPVAFYVPSIIAAVWLVAFSSLYFFKMRESDNHDLYSPDQNASAPLGMRHRVKHLSRSLVKEVGTNGAVWALLPCSMAGTWTTRFFIFYVPNFYRDVLQLPLLPNAVFASLPFLVQIVGKILFSSVSDCMLARRWLSRNVSSKLFNSISFLGSGFCLVLTAYVDKSSRHSVIAVLTTGLAVYSCSAPGYQLSIVSMNKRWTGLISSMCTCSAMVSAITLPYLVAAVVHVGTESEWRTMFFCVAAMDALAALVYLFFGRVDDDHAKALLNQSKSN